MALSYWQRLVYGIVLEMLTLYYIVRTTISVEDFPAGGPKRWKTFMPYKNNAHSSLEVGTTADGGD